MNGKVSKMLRKFSDATKKDKKDFKECNHIERGIVRKLYKNE